MNPCIHPKRLSLALALAVQFLLTPSICRAGQIPVSFAPGDPIVSGSNGGITYNATTGDFNATLTGASLVYAAPFVLPSGFALFSGSLTIDLTVDHSGDFVANCSVLLLTGSVTINGATFSGTLLSGAITDFGAQAAGPPSLTFDGYYTITGGALTQTESGTGSALVFGGFPLGASGGFLLDAENVTGGTLGNFAQNFSSSSDKPEVGVLAVAVAVPAPGTLVLALIGVMVLVGRKRAQLCGGS